MVLIGGSRWTEAAAPRLRVLRALRASNRHHVRRAHLFHALHPNYAGDLGIGPNPKLTARVKASDLVVLVGGRLSEMQSQGYTLIDIPSPQMTFVHVHPGVEELGACIGLILASTPRQRPLRSRRRRSIRRQTAVGQCVEGRP